MGGKILPSGHKGNLLTQTQDGTNRFLLHLPNHGGPFDLNAYFHHHKPKVIEKKRLMAKVLFSILDQQPTYVSLRHDDDSLP